MPPILPQPLRNAAAAFRSARAVVVQGRLEALSEVPFHDSGPLTRWLLASRGLHPEMGFHVAVHEFSAVEPARRSYCQSHVHPYDELNVFHSSTGLRVRVELDEESLLVEAPATILIPAGVRHAANVESGSGILVAILFGGDYQASGPDS